jgi:hypothetical protein
VTIWWWPGKRWWLAKETVYRTPAPLRFEMFADGPAQAVDDIPETFRGEGKESR